jgi:hypothetical protein
MCELACQTKIDGNFVFFCPALPKDGRPVFAKKEDVKCLPGVIGSCKGLEAQAKGLASNHQELQGGGVHRSAQSQATPLIKGIYGAGK